MAFASVFLLIGVISFLPIYLLNVKEQPNPLAFIFEQRQYNRNKFKLLYTKLRFTDPFRINVDFALAVAVCVMLGFDTTTAVGWLTLVLLITTVEITYTAVMTFIFKRAPVFMSDWSLLKSGWLIWKHNRHWLVLALTCLLLLMTVVGFLLIHWLFSYAPPSAAWMMGFAVLICIPALYHWRRYDYSQFYARTFYSSLLHALRNIEFGRRFKPLLNRDKSFFDHKNVFKTVEFDNAPNIVHVCIESYGAITHRQQPLRQSIEPLLSEFQRNLAKQGVGCVSHYSTAPIFTGGSWLSYCSFMYGTKLDDLRLYDGLFQHSDGFGAYESVFHILKRNDYSNILAAPMGGVDNRDISWETIKRCFQADVIIDWETMDFKGKKLKFFNQTHTYCAPDQYALNFGYDLAKHRAEEPFSLFYCTLNSHFPWQSPVEVESDWHRLNDPDYHYTLTDDAVSKTEKYLSALRYQLGLTLDFVSRTAQDAPIIVLFGDHQPPFIATEHDGLDTPVHVFCKDPEVLECFKQHGFTDGLLLDPESPAAIRHESYMSILMNALQKAYGQADLPDIKYLPEGVDLFESGKG